jgi:hypothetical protein
VGWFAVVAVVVVSLVYGQLFAASSRRAKITRKLRSGSPVLADRTMVTLTGTIRATGELLEAPLSGRRCVIVHACAELPELDPRHGTGENVMLTTRLMMPFELETADGIVLVEGTAADLELKPARIVPRSIDRERAFVVAHGRGIEVARVATFREVAVTPGMRVAVHGLALVEAAPDQVGERGYRDAVPTRARLVAHPEYPLAIGKPRP